MRSRKKRILIYAHYYTPDVASTGQIVQDLAEGISNEFFVTVICAVPSYTGVIEKEYKANKFYVEIANKVRIIRVPVPEFQKTSKISRIINIIAYFINARKATRMVGCQDFVFAISQPPILGGMLGVYGKRVLRTKEGKHPKFIYNIHDFNPEQIKVVGYIRIRLIIDLAMWLDKRSCRKSDIVITVGRDLAETLKNRFNPPRVPRHAVINNWIDDNKIHPLSPDDPGVIAFKNEYGLIDKFVFMYSGNIGLYYDLDGLVTVIEKIKDKKTPRGKEVVFAFVGDGALLNKLKQYKTDHNMNNVVFIPYQDKDRLIYSLNAADVHLCLSAKGVKGISVPSKIYGILRVRKPILVVSEHGSEVERMIHDTKNGHVVSPGDYKSLENEINWFVENTQEDEAKTQFFLNNDCYCNKLSKRVSIQKYHNIISNL